MNVLTVIEFDHFISFIIEGPYHVAVQYRIEQVWRDDNGTWQIKSGAVPFHVAQLPPPKPEGDISPHLVEALANAVRGRTRFAC
jgi:hypothetical protein